MKLPPLPPRHGKPFDVVVFGENSVDRIALVTPAGSGRKGQLQTFDRLPGGQAATAAAAVARQGTRVRYLGVIGGDDEGRVVEEALAGANVDAVLRVRDRARTRTALVLVDSVSGERTIFESRDPALALGLDEFPTADLLTGRVLLIDATDLEVSRAAAHAARAAAVPTVVDVDRVRPDLDTLLAEVDVIIAPEEFCLAWTGESTVGAAVRRIADAYRPTAAVATLGKEGSLAVSGRAEIRTPGFPVTARDTTGAGDAFRGGFVSAWARLGEEARLDLVLAHANAAGALNCRALGAQTALPTLPEVLALVTNGPGRRSK